MKSMEIQERNARAWRYIGKCERRWARKEKGTNRFVKRMLTFSVAFFLWAVTLALLVGGV